MKLKRTRSRTYKGKDYYRWTIQLPPGQVVELRWPEGASLVSVVRRGVLQVRRGENVASKPRTRKSVSPHRDD
ncbi:MAG: hypothetical protein WAN74_07535 [Thermoplasmata archaeon]